MTKVEVLYFVKALSLLHVYYSVILPNHSSRPGINETTYPSMFDLQSSVLQPHLELFRQLIHSAQV